MICVYGSRVDLVNIHPLPEKRAVALVVEIDLPPDVPEGSEKAYALAHVGFPDIKFDPEALAMLRGEPPLKSAWDRLLGEEIV